MLSKISGVTAALAAILNAIVLLGWWNLTADQLAGINAAIVAVGAAIHVWNNPNILPNKAP